MKLITIRLTPAEAHHLLSLIEWNDREGEYTEPRAQYWKRSGRIKAKLMAALAPKAPR